MTKVFQFYAELSKSSESDVRQVLSDLHADRKYCVSFELGAETGKEHWQGWIESPEGSVKNDQQMFRNWYRLKGLDGSKNQWTVAMVKNRDPESCKNWFSYIVRNPDKVLDVVITNIPDFESFRNSLVEYLPVKRKASRRLFSEEVFEKIHSECIEVTDQMKVRINYDKMYPVLLSSYAKVFKVFDYSNVLKFLNGASNYLEEMYADQLCHEPKVYNDVMSKLPSYFHTTEFKIQKAKLEIDNIHASQT